jgi:hypothetical protein
MAIDRNRIIESMASIQFFGNDEGLIPAHNLFITQLPTSMWNSFPERLTRRVGPELLEAAEALLVNAAHECGYHTGRGIITSDEWKAIVEPMVEEEPEDILHGAFAVVTAWGWAKAEIVELVPREKMVVRAYDYYESDTVTYGATGKLSAYMIRGVCAAFMDLAYGGDYDSSGRTGLRTFQCVQTKGVECGDPYAEFVVTRTASTET